MSHFRKMCTIKIPVDVLHAVLSLQYPMMIKIGKIQKLLVVLLRLKLINLVE